MLIFALDLGTHRTGWAVGRPGQRHGVGLRSGVQRLRHKDDDADIACGNLGCFLRDQFTFETPDLLIYEATPLRVEDQDGKANRGLYSTVALFQLVGAVNAICAPYGIRRVKSHASTVTKFFLGHGKVQGGRPEKKRAFIAQAQAEGLIPDDCYQDDRADAAALWSFACSKYAPQPADQKPLFMFGERPARERDEGDGLVPF